MHFRTMILGLLRKLRASIYTSKYACSGFKPRQINNIAKLEIMPTVHCISRLTLLGNTRSHQVEMCLMLKQGVSTANVWKGQARLGWSFSHLIVSFSFHGFGLETVMCCSKCLLSCVVLCKAQKKERRTNPGTNSINGASRRQIQYIMRNENNVNHKLKEIYF